MVTVVSNDIFPSNTYIFPFGDKECVLIDPGLDQNAIDKVLLQLNLRPTHILATHGHFDHVGSVSYFQKKYGAPFYIHRFDLKLLQSVNFFLKIMKIERMVDVPVPEYFLEDDTILNFGGNSLYVRNLPGHTPGSCVFAIDKCLFTGDILYAKGVGYNPFPGQDKKKLQSAVKEIFCCFNDELIIYPGHGSADNLGNIRSTNIELKKFLDREY